MIFFFFLIAEKGYFRQTMGLKTVFTHRVQSPQKLEPRIILNVYLLVYKEIQSNNPFFLSSSAFISWYLCYLQYSNGLTLPRGIISEGMYPSLYGG